MERYDKTEVRGACALIAILAITFLLTAAAAAIGIIPC